MRTRDRLFFIVIFMDKETDAVWINDQNHIAESKEVEKGGRKSVKVL